MSQLSGKRKRNNNVQNVNDDNNNNNPNKNANVVSTQQLRILNVYEILENNEYQCIESICIAISTNNQNVINQFMYKHYLNSDILLTKISSILSSKNNKNNKNNKNKSSKSDKSDHLSSSLTASLLLILPFINCSIRISTEIAEKYLRKYDINLNNNFCRGLVFALSVSLNVVSLRIKTWIMSTLSYMIEIQHKLNISNKIKDAYNLVNKSLQILLCNTNCSNYLIKQYSVNILLYELKSGVMARQYLKDQKTNLIILQIIYKLFKIDNNNIYANSHNNNIGNNNEYQWLCVKLLNYLYEAFNYDDLWLSHDDYRSIIINKKQKNQKQKQIHDDLKEEEFTDRIPINYIDIFRNYLMTKYEFAKLLKKIILKYKNDNHGIFVKCAINLLLEYPLNDKYGLTKDRDMVAPAPHTPPHPHTIYPITNHHVTPHPHLHNHNHNHHHVMIKNNNNRNKSSGGSSSNSNKNNKKNKNKNKNKNNNKNKNKSNKSKNKNKNNKNKNNKSNKNNSKRNNNNNDLYDNNNNNFIEIQSINNNEFNINYNNYSFHKNGKKISSNSKNISRKTYSGPEWKISFERLLKNEPQWKNKNIRNINNNISSLITRNINNNYYDNINKKKLNNNNNNNNKDVNTTTISSSSSTSTTSKSINKTNKINKKNQNNNTKKSKLKNGNHQKHKKKQKH